MLEISKISAQGLKTNSFFLSSHQVKPFITITTSPLLAPPPSSSSQHSIKGCNSFHVYSTMVDVKGGRNPIWGDKFLLPLHPTFFLASNYSCVYLHIFTKRALLGPSLLGWIQIPASDIFDGPFSIGLYRHLSYRVREKGGSRGHGVVHVACRFVDEFPVTRHFQSSANIRIAATDTRQIATGIPVITLPMRMK